MQKSSESEKSSELQKSRDTQKSSETPKSTETQKSPNKHGRGRQMKKTAEGKGDGRVKVNKESVKSAERCQSVSSGSHKGRSSTPRPIYRCPRSDTCKYVGMISNVRRHITTYHDGFDLKTLILEKVTGEELEKVMTKRQTVAEKGRQAQNKEKMVQQLSETDDRTTSWVAETINSTRNTLTDVSSVISLDSSKLGGLTCTDEELCHYLSMPNF